MGFQSELAPYLFMEYRASMEALAPSTVNSQRPAFGGTEAGRGGPAKRPGWGRGGGEPFGSPEHPAEGELGWGTG
jgi:hypothetical protein